AHRPGALVATPVHDGRERDDRGGDDEWLGPQSDAVTVVGFDEVDCASMEHEHSLAYGHFVDDGLSVGLGHAHRSGQGRGGRGHDHDPSLGIAVRRGSSPWWNGPAQPSTRSWMLRAP